MKDNFLLNIFIANKSLYQFMYVTVQYKFRFIDFCTFVVYLSSKLQFMLIQW